METAVAVMIGQMVTVLSIIVILLTTFCLIGIIANKLWYPLADNKWKLIGAGLVTAINYTISIISIMILI